jgi:hypothetical protein
LAETFLQDQHQVDLEQVEVEELLLQEVIQELQ